MKTKDYINQETFNVIKGYIGEKRFIHSIGVMETAEKLAKKYGEDIDKAKLAGLFHDIGKFLNKKEAYKFIKENNLHYPKELLDNFQLLHGPLGADFSKIVFKIEDEYILNSIRYHTTLKKNPSLLDKIIYIADAIEPSRDFPKVNELRKKTETNIDEAILLSLNQTILSIIDNKIYLGIDTIEARNYFLELTK